MFFLKSSFNYYTLVLVLFLIFKVFGELLKFLTDFVFITLMLVKPRCFMVHYKLGRSHRWSCPVITESETSKLLGNNCRKCESCCNCHKSFYIFFELLHTNGVELLGKVCYWPPDLPTVIWRLHIILFYFVDLICWWYHEISGRSSILTSFYEM